MLISWNFLVSVGCMEADWFVSWLAHLPLWSRFKYFNNNWMDCHDILYRDSLSSQKMSLTGLGDPLMFYVASW